MRTREVQVKLGVEDKGTVLNDIKRAPSTDDNPPDVTTDQWTFSLS